jgi:hypothetical protein
MTGGSAAWARKRRVVQRSAGIRRRIRRRPRCTAGFNLDLDDVYISSINVAGGDEPVVEMSLSFSQKEKK